MTKLSLASVVLASILTAACSSKEIATSSEAAGTDDSAGSSTGKKSSSKSSSKTSSGTDDSGESSHGNLLTKNLSITEIALNQGVKVDVVAKGKAVSDRNAHLVANRPGLLRVFVTPSSEWEVKKVTATLTIASGKKILKTLDETISVSNTSSDGTLKSTFNFDLGADDLPLGASFSVTLHDEEGEAVAVGESSSARYPKDGSTESFKLTNLAGKLKVVIVPIKYMADGSGRTADVSSEQLEIYRQRLVQLYPIEDAEVTARQAVSWNQAIQYNGSGFDTILNSVINLRQKDGVGDDVYYYAAFEPSSSLASFCGSGCVAGLSSVAQEDDAFLRASVGLGFSGAESADTMAHEVGHAHGRNHSPCGGAQGTDPAYPYSNAVIGVWGYDILNKKLYDPSKAHDMMSYCPNTWVSDFTFEALFQRVAAVNNAKIVNSLSTPQAFRMVTVKEGTFTWGESLSLRGTVGGAAKAITKIARTGRSVPATAHFYPYDHIEGGFYLVPDDGTEITTLQIDGRALNRAP